MLETRLTLTQAAAKLRAGEATPRDLVEACLDRIRRLEVTVRAWVVVDEAGARSEAERLGRLLAEGQDLGPLHGLPLGIKDLIDVAGFPTRAGSPLTSADPVEYDAPVVARLRAAGAIILGKTVTTEWACFDPPPTRNPWNLRHTPGGSSSGSAAAVATGMCLAALGSQTGGSIIRPAAYCGVTGLKPTIGRVSTRGVVPISPHLDHVGPLGTSVADLWQVLRVVADDGPQLPIDVEQPADNVRLGWLGGLFDTDAAPDVRLAFRQTLELLRGSWPELREYALPSSFADLHAAHWRIMAVDAASVHRADFAARPDAFGPKVSSLIAEGLATTPVDYLAALRHQATVREDLTRLLGNDLVLLMPSTNTTAPGLESTGNPRFNSPWSLAGVPALTLPCGRGDHGLPCGLQLIGPSGRDDLVVRAALAIERRLPPIGCPVDGLGELVS